MADKLTLQPESASTSGQLFSDHSPVPLPDDEENPWGGPDDRRTGQDTPPSPSPSPSPPRSIRKVPPPPPRPNPNHIANDVEPPMYSGPSNPRPSSSATSQPLHSLVPGLPPLSFAAYAPAGCSQSWDQTKISITNPPWAASLDSFTKAIYEQIALPPRAEIRILGQGAHRDPGFNIRLNATRYFLPREGESGLSYVKAKPLPGRPASPTAAADVGLQECVQAFWLDPARPKSFTVTRQLSNWDTDFIVGRIHALSASLNIPNHVRVEFPRAHTRFTVTVEDEARSRSLASTILSAFKASRDYGVHVVWPYADAARFEGDEALEAARSGGRRTCLVRSEEGWWSDWRGVVREAMRTNRQGGWVGLEEWMEVAMRPRGP